LLWVPLQVIVWNDREQDVKFYYLTHNNTVKSLAFLNWFSSRIDKFVSRNFAILGQTQIHCIAALARSVRPCLFVHNCYATLILRHRVLCRTRSVFDSVCSSLARLFCIAVASHIAYRLVHLLVHDDDDVYTCICVSYLYEWLLLVLPVYTVLFVSDRRHNTWSVVMVHCEQFVVGVFLWGRRNSAVSGVAVCCCTLRFLGQLVWGWWCLLTLGVVGQNV